MLRFARRPCVFRRLQFSVVPQLSFSIHCDASSPTHTPPTSHTFPSTRTTVPPKLLGSHRASKHTVSSTAATSSRCSRCGILVTYGCIAARLCYRICFRCKREMLPPGEWLYYLPEIDARDRIYVVFGECAVPPPPHLPLAGIGAHVAAHRVLWAIVLTCFELLSFLSRHHTVASCVRTPYGSLSAHGRGTGASTPGGWRERGSVVHRHQRGLAGAIWKGPMPRRPQGPLPHCGDLGAGVRVRCGCAPD